MGRTDHYDDPDAPKATTIKPAVSAFVRDPAGRLLMIRRTDNDLYAIPGGAQEPGETLAEAVVREVREETGIIVEVVGVVGLYSDPAHVIAFDDGEVRQEFSICFRAQPVDGNLRSSSETKEALWVRLDQLDILPIHPSIRKRITHGLERRVQPFYS